MFDRKMHQRRMQRLIPLVVIAVLVLIAVAIILANPAGAQS